MPTKSHPRIVITGAPASGKTEFIERLKREPELAGFCFFEELARLILSARPELRNNRSALHREIYRRQTAREDELGDRPMITDRGTVDAFAFHPETLAEVGTTLEREYGRYTLVIQLGSAAGLEQAFYVQDNIRTETAAEALIIEEAIRKAWDGHPGYKLVAARVDLEEKYSLLRQIIVDHI